MTTLARKPLQKKKLNTSTTRKINTQRPAERRAHSLPLPLKEPIAYVNHPAFQRKNVEAVLQRLAPVDPPQENSSPDEAGVTFVAGFVSHPLLTAADEQSLFAWMNYHRFRAETQRQRALVSRTPQRYLVSISQELTRANELRNRIVSSNLRLVVALAKKLSSSLDQMSELISEGVLPLIRAVELFDISLGNRFSTYATWAVRNQMLRVLKRTQAAASRWGESIESLPETLPARPEAEDLATSPAESIRRVQLLLAALPDRERHVVQARFGLEGEPTGQSLADIAAKVGLSKERVRQLVLNSLAHLRSQIRDNELRTTPV